MIIKNNVTSKSSLHSTVLAEFFFFSDLTGGWRQILKIFVQLSWSILYIAGILEVMVKTMLLQLSVLAFYLVLGRLNVDLVTTRCAKADGHETDEPF